MRITRVCRVKNTCAVHVQLSMKGQLTHNASHDAWQILCIGIPSLDHFVSLPWRKRICNGNVKLPLKTIAASLTASCQKFAVNTCHGRTVIGLPVSFIFRRPVVMAMIARPIQNRTKKPLKSLYSLLGSKWDTRAEYCTVGNIRSFC